MALEMIYNLQGDYPITAYVRIKRVDIRHDVSKAQELGGTKWVASIFLEAKSAKEKNSLDTWSSEAWDFAYNPNGNDALQQAYNHLKTLPEFSIVIDRND